MSYQLTLSGFEAVAAVLGFAAIFYLLGFYRGRDYTNVKATTQSLE